MKTKLTIERFPVADSQGEWQTALQKVSCVHHGYVITHSQLDMYMVLVRNSSGSQRHLSPNSQAVLKFFI